MKQKPIRTVGDALHQSTLAIAGGTELGENGPKYNTPEAIGANRATLVTKRNEHEAARTTLKSCKAALAAVMFVALVFLTSARDLLKRQLGSRYSEAWDAAGFRRSLAIPRRVKDVKVLLETLHGYYTANASAQNNELGITATEALTIFNNLCAAENALNLQKSATGVAKKDRDTAFKALKNQLTRLFKELGETFDSVDDRWVLFGFNKPGVKETPPAPTGVTAVLIGTHAIALKWAAAARADYYRVWVKYGDADQPFVPVGSPADLDFTIERLTENSEFEIAVSAVNNGGESALSKVVLVSTL